MHWEGCDTEEDTWEEAAALGRYSHFTYFTSTNVQKLTWGALLRDEFLVSEWESAREADARESRRRRDSSALGDDVIVPALVRGCPVYELNLYIYTN